MTGVARPSGWRGKKPGDASLLKQEVKLELEDESPTLVAERLFYLYSRALGETLADKVDPVD